MKKYLILLFLTLFSSNLHSYENINQIYFPNCEDSWCKGNHSIKITNEYGCNNLKKFKSDFKQFNAYGTVFRIDIDKIKSVYKFYGQDRFNNDNLFFLASFADQLIAIANLDYLTNQLFQCEKYKKKLYYGFKNLYGDDDFHGRKINQIEKYEQKLVNKFKNENDLLNLQSLEGYEDIADKINLVLKDSNLVLTDKRIVSYLEESKIIKLFKNELITSAERVQVSQDTQQINNNPLNPNNLKQCEFYLDQDNLPQVKTLGKCFGVLDSFPESSSSYGWIQVSTFINGKAEGRGVVYNYDSSWSSNPNVQTLDFEFLGKIQKINLFLNSFHIYNFKNGLKEGESLKCYSAKMHRFFEWKEDKRWSDGKKQKKPHSICLDQKLSAENQFQYFKVLPIKNDSPVETPKSTKVAQSDSKVSTLKKKTEQVVVTSTKLDKKSLKEELQYWKELFEDELITQAEYDAKRKELLSGASVTTKIVNVEQPTTNSNQEKIDLEKAKLEEMKKQTELAKKDLEEQKKIAAEAKAQADQLDYQYRMEQLQKGIEGIQNLSKPNYLVEPKPKINCQTNTVYKDSFTFTCK